MSKPCKIWTKSTSAGGYGKTWRNGKCVDIHRWTYEQAHGPLPEGMCALHSCDNRLCYELEHLFPGTKADNSKDMAQKDRVHFGTGHHHAKLDEWSVRAIRADTRPYSEIAADYGISKQNISKVKRRQLWARV